MLEPIRELLTRLMSLAGLATNQKKKIADLSDQILILTQDKSALSAQLAIELANNPAEQSAIEAAQEAARLAQLDVEATRGVLEAFQAQTTNEVETLRAEMVDLLSQLTEASSEPTQSDPDPVV